MKKETPPSTGECPINGGCACSSRSRSLLSHIVNCQDYMNTLNATILRSNGIDEMIAQDLFRFPMIPGIISPEFGIIIGKWSQHPR